MFFTLLQSYCGKCKCFASFSLLLNYFCVVKHQWRAVLTTLLIHTLSKSLSCLPLMHSFLYLITLLLCCNTTACSLLICVCPKEQLGSYLTESKNLCGLDVSMLKTALKIHHLFAFPYLVTRRLSFPLYWDAVLGILKSADVLPVLIIS